MSLRRDMSMDSITHAVSHSANTDASQRDPQFNYIVSLKAEQRLWQCTQKALRLGFGLSSIRLCIEAAVDPVKGHTHAFESTGPVSQMSQRQNNGGFTLPGWQQCNSVCYQMALRLGFRKGAELQCGHRWLDTHTSQTLQAARCSAS